MKNIPLLLLLGLPDFLLAQSIFDSIYTVRSVEVHFATGQADLSRAAQETLDSLAYFFQPISGGSQIRITAHADSLGESRANDALSQRRAAMVQKRLISRGIGVDKIHLSAFGEHRPATQNASEEGRQKNRRATIEIWRAVPMVALAGQVVDKKTGEGIAATLIFNSKTRSDSITTDTVGHYSVQLPKDTVVSIEVSSKDHFFETVIMRMFGSPELMAKYKFDPTISLQPARPGDIVILHRLFFIGGTANLLEFSKPELPKILHFLQAHPNLHFEIAGHINAPGVKPKDVLKSDWKVSVDRAQMVYKYLRDHGIPPDRMTYKGYGNQQMLFSDTGATREEQQQNRRIEIRILGE